MEEINRDTSRHFVDIDYRIGGNSVNGRDDRPVGRGIIANGKNQVSRRKVGSREIDDDHSLYSYLVAPLIKQSIWSQSV